jgi:glutaminyl-peptide cyclotransferase
MTRTRKAPRQPPPRPRRAAWLVPLLILAVAIVVLIQARARPPQGAAAPPPTPATSSTPPIYGYRVVQAYPHDREAYTQGLLFREGVLFESTGLHGRSSVRRVRLETGEVLQRRDVDSLHFGEGLTDWGDTLVQLTWQSGVGFVYDLKTFAPSRSFNYTGEGWGLTHDGKRLIMSDGTAVLRFLDPSTLQQTGEVVVTDRGAQVRALNELEFIGGEVFANIYQSDLIARIDPASGRVIAWIDLTGILPLSDQNPPVDVLNGIAYDRAGDRLFVTGKLWPKLFEIDLVPKPN